MPAIDKSTFSKSHVVKNLQKKNSESYSKKEVGINTGHFLNKNMNMIWKYGSSVWYS